MTYLTSDALNNYERNLKDFERMIFLAHRDEGELIAGRLAEVHALIAQARQALELAEQVAQAEAKGRKQGIEEAIALLNPKQRAILSFNDFREQLRALAGGEG